MARKRQPSKEKIQQALEAFILAETWDESRIVVKERQRVLLNDAALSQLAKLLEEARAAAAEDEFAAQAVPGLIEHLELLRRCREVGIDAAFDEFLAEQQAARDRSMTRLVDYLGALTPEEYLALNELADDPPALEERMLAGLAWEEGEPSSPSPLATDAEAVWYLVTLFRLMNCDGLVELVQLALDEPGLLDDDTLGWLQDIADAAAAAADEGSDVFSQELNERLEALREIAEEQAEREAENERMISSLQEFVSQESWGKSHALLGAHPELLTFEAGEFLEQMVDELEGEVDEEIVAVLRLHLELLRRSREVGRDAAFSELLGE